MSKPDWVSDLVHEERRRARFEGGSAQSDYEKNAEIIRLRKENYQLKELIRLHNIEIKPCEVPTLESPGNEYLLCEWLIDLHGSIIWSFTKQKDTDGQSVKYTCDFSTGNKQVYVHKADLADARAAGFWRVIT